MAEQTIVFAQGIEMPPDILAQVQQMKPADFRLQQLPPAASAAEIAAAIREAEYLLGFPRFLPDEAYTEAKRLKLLQVLSAGYDYVNIAGARQARIPICTNGGANSVAVAEHAIMLMLAVYRKLLTFHQNVAAGRWHQGIPRTVDIFELEEDGDELVAVQFVILRHPRPYAFSKQFHEVLQLYRYDIAARQVLHVRSLNVSRMKGGDGVPSGRGY